MIEIAISEMIVRAGADVDETQLHRVIRAARSA
ncbi:IS66 family insertion sequence hypothetical protein [Bradyrhizobium sp. UFLA03-84]|nr:IS66 family insertion sequence hypothetical protein [Bradyrhizobium sp. UFLA03-84]